MKKTWIFLIILCVLSFISLPFIKQHYEKKILLETANELINRSECLEYIIEDNVISPALDVKAPLSGLIQVNDKCEKTMTITDGKYQIEVINNGEPKFVELKKYKAFKNGEIVMFDPTGTGEKEKWYAFDDHMYKDTVKLIKASNLNNEPYKELIVDSWQYPGRSLTLKELGKLTGKTNFDTFKDGAMYLDKSLNWLFDQTGPNCEAIGCPTNSANANNYGYWLAETVSDPAYQGYAWVIDKEGRLNISQVNAGSKFGFRPVITVPKNIIS